MKPVMVTSATKAGLVTLPCYPTGVPGLLVRQTPPGYRCAGKWRVIHARSGSALSWCLPDPEAALGAALAAADVTDWQQPIDVINAVAGTGAVVRALSAYTTARCLNHTHAHVGNDNGVIA
jgi:hypothetical protein